MSSYVNGWINGVPLVFDPSVDSSQIQVEENVSVHVVLRFPPHLARPNLCIDLQALDPVRVEKGLIEWVWLSGDAAGDYDVELLVDGQTYISGLRVIPTKVSLDQYHLMTSEIDSLAAALHFDFFGRGALEHTAFGWNGPKDLPGEFRLLTNLGARFLQAASEILKNPEADLVSQRRLQRLGAVRRVDSTDWTPLMRAATLLQSCDAEEPVFSQMAITEGLDIQENRYVKYVLSSLILRLARFRTRLDDEIDRTKSLKQLLRGAISRPVEARRSRELVGMRQGAELLQNRLRRLEQETWFREITLGPATPTLRTMSIDAYREVHFLAQSMSLSEGVVSVVDARSAQKRAVKPIQDIYELWCYLAVAEVLRTLGAVVTPPNAITEHIQGQRIRLKVTEGTTISFLWDDGEGRLIWMPAISKLDRGSQYHRYTGPDPITPDMIMELEYADGRRRLIILDAKYRRNPKDGSSKDEDKSKALLYWSRLVPKDGYDKPYSCVLYAGSVDEDLTVVRAIPLKPGETDSLARFLRSLIGIS